MLLYHSNNSAAGIFNVRVIVTSAPVGVYFAAEVCVLPPYAHVEEWRMISLFRDCFLPKMMLINKPIMVSIRNRDGSF